MWSAVGAKITHTKSVLRRREAGSVTAHFPEGAAKAQSHRSMLKARCDLGTNIAARPQEGPGAIQAIRDGVFRPKWHVALTAVNAFTDLPAPQGDVIIHKTSHDSIVARETTTTQGLTVLEIVDEEERTACNADIPSPMLCV